MEKDRENFFSFADFKLPERKKNITNRRQSIIKDFVDAINLERYNTKFKPVTGKQIALRLAHLSEDDMYYFLSQCRKYKLENKSHSFSKCFYGALKTCKEN